MKQSHHNSGRQVTKELNIAFTYYVASRGFHYHCTAAWTDIYEGEPVFIKTETNIESLQLDRFACSIIRTTPTRGLLCAMSIVVDMSH